MEFHLLKVLKMDNPGAVECRSNLVTVFSDEEEEQSIPS